MVNTIPSRWTLDQEPAPVSRAAVDVANAILDGTDAVDVVRHESIEKVKYPLEAVTIWPFVYVPTVMTSRLVLYRL